MTQRHCAWLWCVLVVGLFSGKVHAENDEVSESIAKPLWEFGVFGAVGRLPDYAGADEYTLYPLPLPYVIYRGEWFETDRDGVNGVFYRSPRTVLKLSLSGHPPVSSDNKARVGMDELDPLLEGGLTFNCYAIKNEENCLYSSIAVRQVVAIDDLALRGEGIIGTTKLTFRDFGMFGDPQWVYGITGALRVHNTDYNDYFYSVGAEDATPERPEYRAEGGYGGFTLSQNVVYRRSESLSLGVYMMWINLDGTVMVDSPLVKTHDNLVLGVAIIKRLGRSTRTVAR